MSVCTKCLQVIVNGHCGCPIIPVSEIESLQRALADARYAVGQLRADLAEAQAEIARWKKAVEGLTPTGSEYVDDPELCAKFIRHRSSYPPIIARLQRELADARAENARLTAELEQAEAKLTAADDCPLAMPKPPTRR